MIYPKIKLHINCKIYERQKVISTKLTLTTNTNHKISKFKFCLSLKSPSENIPRVTQPKVTRVKIQRLVCGKVSYKNVEI